MNKWLLLVMVLISCNSYAEEYDYEKVANELPHGMTQLAFEERSKNIKGKSFKDFGTIKQVAPHKTNNELAVVIFEVDPDDERRFPDFSIVMLKKDAITLNLGDVKEVTGTIAEIIDINGPSVIVANAVVGELQNPQSTK